MITTLAWVTEILQVPTLPAPRQRSFGTLQSSESRCAPPERTWGEDLGLGLLLLAAGATRTYSHQTTMATPSNTSSQTASPAPHPANATTKAGDGTLQSAASLCDLRLPSTSLLLRDSGEETAVLHHLLNPVQMASVHPV